MVSDILAGIAYRRPMFQKFKLYRNADIRVWLLFGAMKCPAKIDRKSIVSLRDCIGESTENQDYKGVGLLKI